MSLGTRVLRPSQRWSFPSSQKEAENPATRLFRAALSRLGTGSKLGGEGSRGRAGVGHHCWKRNAKTRAVRPGLGARPPPPTAPLGAVPGRRELLLLRSYTVCLERAQAGNMVCQGQTQHLPPHFGCQRWGSQERFWPCFPWHEMQPHGVNPSAPGGAAAGPASAPEGCSRHPPPGLCWTQRPRSLLGQSAEMRFLLQPIHDPGSSSGSLGPRLPHVFQIPAQRRWPEHPHLPGVSLPTAAAVPAGQRCLPAGAAVPSKSFP